MQEVQEGNEDSDLATIRAWREKRTDGRMMKAHLTAPQHVMYEDLKLRLKAEVRKSINKRKPTMENDASQARLIRGLQRLTVSAEVRQWEWIQQNIVQVAVQAETETALKLAVIAQAQVTCGACIFNVPQTHFTGAGSGALCGAGEEKAEGSR